MTLLDSVRRAVAVASAGGHVGVLVGGLAVSARAEPRFTRDADLVIALDADVEAEAVVRAFLLQGYQLRALLEQSSVGRISGARLIDPDGVDVDLLTASSGIEAEIVAAADELEIVGGLRVHVAATGHLIALKLLSVAPGRDGAGAVDHRSCHVEGRGPALSGVSLDAHCRVRTAILRGHTMARRRRLRHTTNGQTLRWDRKG